ncbi:hypothetical protein BK702_04895 [Bacillus thuringiensis serovar cameroun]|uniref:Parasporal crystal protein C53 n=1 Tax=Bacillus thuringiensis TaxID=1428 RepID=Q45728_BACTU|nr:hypothetical protein BK702_04895 [Bacillus thuringiensis serovar cameroun]CAA67205.1 parasporal crystal protein C53 [Bacillus thuringiensis serovar cameroun]
MKKSCDPNPVNQSTTTTFDLDDFLLNNMFNVTLQPANIWYYQDEWPYESPYVPTPTSDDLSKGCWFDAYVPTCRYDHAPGYTANTSGLMAEGTDLTEEIDSVAYATPYIADSYTFTNDGPITQEYQTLAYEQAVETSTSNTTTHGCRVGSTFGYSRNSTFTAKIRDTEKGFHLDVGAEYDFTNTNTFTTSTTTNVLVPSQVITVPSYCTAYVTMVLNKATYAKADVPLITTLSGRFFIDETDNSDEYFDIYPYVELVTTCCTGNCSQCVTDQLQLDAVNRTVIFDGLGSFEANIASNELIVRTKLVDNVTGATISEQAGRVPVVYGPSTTKVTTS